MNCLWGLVSLAGTIGEREDPAADPGLRDFRSPERVTDIS
ncbi:hypothetical protein G9444_5334 [Rhodococcus erythropolis]|uniref:Uncharacterized protein n=1 Tax=Rhodococcus erythropolis TaxID=1833 RepID=A0A6G9D023_RHOER|nr:hypothetical protein G9444_5334 [Rhodococcus erythropolis]